MADQVNPIKLKLAQRITKLFLTQMASVPADVQLMSIELLARTIFLTDIRAEKRLEFFDRWSGAIRNAIKADLKQKKKAQANG